MTNLLRWWHAESNPWRDRLQNILEDWTGNAILAALLCAFATFINLIH